MHNDILRYVDMLKRGEIKMVNLQRVLKTMNIQQLEIDALKMEIKHLLKELQDLKLSMPKQSEPEGAKPVQAKAAPRSK